TREQWQRLVAGVLSKAGASDVSGAAAEDALGTRLEDGLTARPLYTADDHAGVAGYPGFWPFRRGGPPRGKPTPGLDGAGRHAHSDALRTNEAILADLENGVSSVWLAVGAAGVPTAALAAALDGVYLDLAPLVLDAGAEFEAAARALFGMYEKRGVAPGAAL